MRMHKWVVIIKQSGMCALGPVLLNPNPMLTYVIMYWACVWLTLDYTTAHNDKCLHPHPLTNIWGILLPVCLLLFDSCALLAQGQLIYTADDNPLQPNFKQRGQRHWCGDLACLNHWQLVDDLLEVTNEGHMQDIRCHWQVSDDHRDVWGLEDFLIIWSNDQRVIVSLKHSLFLHK